MRTQPEALRLADELENLEATGWGGDCFALTEHSQQQAGEAAAELRRLHAQRDALLEALKDATKTIEHLGYPLAAIERARAAIKAVEETK